MSIRNGNSKPIRPRRTSSGIAGLPIGAEGAEPTIAKPVIAPSPQQQAVIDWVCDGIGSAFIEALAGTGKTFTLIAASRVMHGSVAFAAFNKKIAEEIRAKTKGQPNVRASTFHSFGLSAWRNVASPSLQIDDRAKTRMMNDTCEVPWPMRSAVSQLVSMAKQSAVDIEWSAENPSSDSKWRELIERYDILLRVEDDGRSTDDVVDDLIYLTVKCLGWARRVGKDIIDYDDMIWLPLVENCAIQKYDWVIVDECQDSNPVRRLLARRMMHDNSRSLWAGDRYQSIYGFAGATPNAVDLIVSDFGCQTLPLTVTFRCSKAATRLAQTWVPSITAHEANEEGSVVAGGQFAIYIPNPGDHPEWTAQSPAPLAPGDAILCRNTKPLVALAFSLIREGIACHVEGRDIGKSLDRLASKWRVDTVTALVTNLEAHRRRETERLIAQDARYAIEALNDRIDTVMIITEGCETVQEVRDKISRMFDDTDGSGEPKTVLLSTIHRVKGREWNRVFILGWGVYMPSKWARQDWEVEQERNLQYVGITRCRRDLILTGAVE